MYFGRKRVSGGNETLLIFSTSTSVECVLLEIGEAYALYLVTDFGFRNRNNSAFHRLV